ncbi:MAG: transglutaminase domain-containing protein [bacterium]
MNYEGASAIQKTSQQKFEQVKDNNKSNSLFKSQHKYKVDDFAYPVSYDDEQQEISRLLDIMGVKTNDPSVVKIQKIASSLFELIFPFRGQPDEFLRHLSGYEQLQAILAGRSQAYCANHAEIFAHLMTVAGVPTRIVDVSSPKSAGHAFNESYIVEQQKWAYVDLQLSVGLISDALGKPINGIDVLNLSRSGEWNSVQIHVLGGPETIQLQPVEISNLIEQFVPPDSTLKYLWGTSDRFSFLNRLKRFFLNPPPAFSLESKTVIDASFRQAAILLLLLALIFLSLFHLKRLLRDE